MKQLLVKGHTLVYEGAPHDEERRVLTVGGWIRRGWSGRALCSCGELSEVLPSSVQRRTWHRAHKEAVLDAQEGQ